MGDCALSAQLNIDLRAAVRLAADSWYGSLIAMFGPSPNLVAVLVVGVLLVSQQVWRRQFFVGRTEEPSRAHTYAPRWAAETEPRP
ncbi:MAG: hypothetical protein AAF436_09080 [Myxococcota bacterium]